MALTAGTLLGPYEILARIGAGGMGEVYKARDKRLDRVVAVKVSKDQFSERFAREARAIAALNHPNICHLYDIVISKDTPNYLVMEYVEGAPVRPVDEHKLIDLAVQIADGLTAAHAKGIVHRDLKPGNILVTRDGQIKILDFGLALHTHGRPEAPDATETIGITEAGTTVGTVAYMSPEQARGETVDARSDLWSAGVVLYEMATGTRPFEGATNAVLFEAILNRTPAPVHERNPKVPSELERIVTRLLEKDRALRYQSAADLCADLKRVERDSSSGRTIATPAPSPPVAWRKYALAVAVLILIAAGISLWQRTQAKPLTDKDVLVLADFTNTTADTVFDGTLREALAVQLEESPFLKILSDDQVRQDLQLMGRKPSDRITNDVAREICQRENEKAVIGGSIASLGKSYAVTLESTNCQSGDTMARAQAEAQDQEHVLDAVASAAKGMREKLGESLSSIQKLEPPRDRVTTTSLPAFQAFATGLIQFRQGAYLAAIPLFQHATELDPNFATAWEYLATAYVTSGDNGEHYRLAYQKSFDLRDRVSERERFSITSLYYEYAVGEYDKAREAAEVWTRTYPRDHVPHNSLGTLLLREGQFEQALQEFQDGYRLEPRNSVLHGNLINAYVRLDRYDEAKATIAQELTHNSEESTLHRDALRIGFILGDEALVQKETQWFSGKPSEYLAVQGHAANALFLGQRRQAAGLLQQAGELRTRRGLSAGAGISTQDDALVGSCESTQRAPTAAAVALALCGDAAQTAKALKRVEDAAQQQPDNQELSAVQLPLFRAAAALKQDQPAMGVEQLQSMSHMERRYPEAIYIRAQAYLRLHKGAEAAAEFQKLVDRKGANWGPFYPVSLLGLARGAALAGDAPKAKKAYQDFLALWKDADPDIPILIEAQTEYAALH